jgi:DNA-binding SARP family transcriptional activator/tetratricopeptide (TPR) repeat protein
MRDNGDVAVRVRLLGPFSVVSGGRAAGPWPRPSARRLCQLVLVSPGRRVSRDLVCEELFADLDPRAAARSVSKALSMARAALSNLGEPATSLLEADLTHIWANPAVEVDAVKHEQALRTALAITPGHERDDLLATALADDGELLADEPYADWALRPRERLETLRQEARLALARDRAKGAGDSRPEAQLAAWAACAEHDPASEEAAAALVRGYFAAGHRELAVRAYERCRAALGDLGLGLSPWLEEVYATAAFEAGAPRTQAPAREELRTITVLAAEVAVTGSADPEERRDVAGRALAAAIAEVEALGGTVTSVSGGGLQAMFGAPEAHEDDPERAARAAFRALTAVAAIDGGTLRIGVETGPAVLGPIGGGARVEYGAVGEVVGQAAALQALARPGSALVGPVTRAAAGHLFAWGAAEGDGTYLGPPMPRIAGHRLRPGGPLVGRQAELAALGTALREAARGHGSVVLVTGEPGLGKTRLVQECRRRAARGTRWLEGSCASYASSTPYGLYQQLLANWAGVTPDQPAAVTGPALERVLAAVRAGDLFPLLARMMGLPPGAALGRMGPGELQKQTFAAWRTLTSRLVATGPVVLVLEDLHWADPTSLRLTLELARLAAGHAEGWRLLILATGRPEAAPALDSLDARRLELGPLGGAAEEELARSLMGDGTSREVLDTVLASTDGNPLFLEERLSSLLETSALVREHGAWRLGQAAGAQVPQALERMVRSRVDRLSPAARDAVRPASVLGTEFPLSLLAAVCAAGEPLDAALDELRARDFLHEVAGRAEPVYRFRHALIQEATYNGLLRAERRLLHGRAAWALEAAADGRTDEVAAVLGRHFAAAGEPERALRYYEIAGDHATASFANDEAISSYRAALEIAGEGEAPMKLQVELQAKLANVLWRTQRRGQAREAFQAALRAVPAGDTLRRAHLLTRLGRLEVSDSHYEAAWAAYDAAEDLLGGNPEEMDAATVEEWLELMVDGRACQYTTEHQVEQALATLDAVRPVIGRGSAVRKHGYYFHLAMARVALNRFRVDETDLDNARRSLAAALDAEEKDVGYATFFLARFLLLHGDLAEAQDHLEQSLAMAERIGETALRAYSLLGLAMAALRRHDTAEVRALLPRVLAEAETIAGPDYLAGAKAFLAWLAWLDRHPDDVIKLAEEIATLMTGTPDAGLYYGPVHLWPLAAVHLEAGHLAEAVAATRRLRDHSQLPADLEAALTAASQAYDQDQPGLTRDHLTAALGLARDLGYF